MAKLTKDELIQKIVSSVENEDVQISLIEDVTDSMEIDGDNAEKEALRNQVEEYKMKYEDIKARYKERFLTGKEEIIDEVIEEPKEEEIIDVKEI